MQEHAQHTPQDAIPEAEVISDKSIRLHSTPRLVFGSILLFIGLWSLLYQFALVPNPFDVIDILFDYSHIIFPVIVMLSGLWLMFRAFSRGEEKKESKRYYAHRDTKRLYRSTEDKRILGIAGGVAHYFEWDPTLVRILFVILFFATSGFMLLVYLVMAFIIPKDSELIETTRVHPKST